MKGNLVSHHAKFDFSTTASHYVTMLDVHLPYRSFVVRVGISIQLKVGTGFMEIHACQDGSGAIQSFDPRDAQDYTVAIHKKADCISFKLCSMVDSVRLQGAVTVVSIPPDPSVVDRLAKIGEDVDE